MQEKAGSPRRPEGRAVIDLLRRAREASPFLPFALRLTDGRVYRVPSRDHVAIAPSGRTLIVYETDEAFRVIDSYLVAGLATESTRQAA